MIQIQSLNPNILHVSTMDVHGGKMITVELSRDVLDIINWARTYREKLDREVRLREQTPALANSWDEYQTMLKIVLDQI